MRTTYPKDPSENVYVTWDFTRDLVAGETLTGLQDSITPVTSNVQVSGPPDPAIDNMLIGNPVISGNVVQQMISLGMLGATYALTAKCQTSLNRVLKQGGEMFVINAYLMT